MATRPKPVPDAAEAGPAQKSSKKIFVILAVAVLAVAGAAGWYFTRGASATAPEAAKPKAEPKFFTLEPFTVNLQKDESDQFLQVGITLKVANSSLEDQLKQHLPEIRSHLLMLLSSKHASELTSVDGKVKLANEIISEVQRTLGLPVEAPAPAAAAASEVASAVASGVPAAEPAPAQPGSIEVLFTSFIIQ